MAKILAALWELKMFKLQKPMLNTLRKEIETKMLEVQVRQLDGEIKECLNKLSNAESFSEEDYAYYQNLKKERQALIESGNLSD